MRHTLPASLLCLALASVPRAQSVSCEKFTLPNGMTVILHEDHRVPVATVNIWYRVGSQDEPPQRSGFAHLFEHLMFMGTARVPGNAFDVLMETGGGANNASTDFHRTNYFSWGPSKLLPTLLWLDADRLEDMGNTMTQEKLDKQRDVVRNELRQNVENAPYGKADEAIYKLVYPPDHPYFTGVIGTHADLEAATVGNVKDFFANFYVPSNASLVVAGDFETAKIKPLVSQLFGTLPPGAPVTRKYTRGPRTTKVQIAGTKRLSFIDAVQIPKVQMTWHSPAAYAPGDAEAHLLAALLSDGKSSRLYRRLVIQDALASEVSASHRAYPLGSLFQIDVMVKPGVALEAVESAVDRELATLCEKGPSENELARAKAGREASVLKQLQSIERKADKLNEYEYYWGEPDSFRRDLERFRAVTPKSLGEWAGTILDPEARAIVRVLPEKPTRPASARDQRPAEASSSAFQIPEPARTTLANGIEMLVFHRPELPLVEVELVSRPGTVLDARGKEGLAELMARMLGEGAGDLDATAFDDAIQAIGADFSAYAQHESLHVRMSLLSSGQDRALDLLATAMRRPRFSEADFERVKSLMIEAHKRAEDEPGSIASRFANRILWGKDHPYAKPTTGTVESLRALTLADVKMAWTALLRPSGSKLLVAGNLDAAAAKAAFDRVLTGWKDEGEALPSRVIDETLPQREALEIHVVERSGATQTLIHFAAPGVALRSPERVSHRLVNTILGDGFTSRLNQNLRERNGFTYGAGSRFVMNVRGGSFVATSSVRGDATEAALREFLAEFRRIRSGDIQDDEAEKARETLANETIQPFSRLTGLLGNAATALCHDLPLDTASKDLASMAQASTAELNRVAARAFPVDRGVLVLVGDRAVIAAALAKLGLSAQK